LLSASSAATSEGTCPRPRSVNVGAVEAIGGVCQSSSPVQAVVVLVIAEAARDVVGGGHVFRQAVEDLGLAGGQWQAEPRRLTPARARS